MDIRDAAAKYLASRARSTGETKTYLKSKGYEDGEIDRSARENVDEVLDE